jgi:hypothetical protein
VAIPVLRACVSRETTRAWLTGFDHHGAHTFIGMRSSLSEPPRARVGGGCAAGKMSRRSLGARLLPALDRSFFVPKSTIALCKAGMASFRKRRRAAQRVRQRPFPCCCPTGDPFHRRTATVSVKRASGRVERVTPRRLYIVDRPAIEGMPEADERRWTAARSTDVSRHAFPRRWFVATAPLPTFDRRPFDHLWR